MLRGAVLEEAIEEEVKQFETQGGLAVSIAVWLVALGVPLAVLAYLRVKTNLLGRAPVPSSVLAALEGAVAAKEAHAEATGGGAKKGARDAQQTGLGLGGGKPAFAEAGGLLAGASYSNPAGRFVSLSDAPPPQASARRRPPRAAAARLSPTPAARRSTRRRPRARCCGSLRRRRVQKAASPWRARVAWRLTPARSSPCPQNMRLRALASAQSPSA